MEHKFKEQMQNLRIESAALDQVWNEFVTPKERTMANFKEGVERFIRIANLHPEERLTFYGSRFAGLYNNLHLAQLWNETCLPDEMIAAHDLDDIEPGNWKLAGDTGFALKYMGPDPANALKELLKGPSVIDCGMFCQLGIWFGILYMLGDTQFNENFASEPFLITRFLYYKDQEEEHSGNPLFDFFTEQTLDSVAIEHVFNDPFYKFKHPGGNSQGENCLVVTDDYYQFEPLTYEGKLTRAEIIDRLLETYNRKPDTNDADTTSLLSERRDVFEHFYGSIFQTQFSPIVMYKLLRFNPPILQEAAELLFGNEIAPKEEFLSCFEGDMSDAQQEHLEGFLSIPAAQSILDSLISRNALACAAFYRGIFNEFSEFHKSLSKETLSTGDFLARQSMIDRPVSSFLYFNLDAFLLTLKKERLHTSTSELPFNKRSRSEAESTSVSTAMGIFSNSGLPTVPATQSRLGVPEDLGFHCG